MKKDNKGFSLVELIVVVLIMGILAVALTPQVIKWVNNSRIAADKNNYESLCSSLNLALANETLYGKVKGGDYTLTMTTTGTSFTADTTDGDLDAAMDKVAPKYDEIKSKLGTYTISIKKGTVEKTTHPGDDSSMDQ